MSLPLFIEDGYTVTAKIPADKDGLHGELSIRYRPIVGAARSEWLTKHESSTAEQRLAMTYTLIADHCLDICGLGKLTEDRLAKLNPNALIAVRNYIALLDARAVVADVESQKN